MYTPVENPWLRSDIERFYDRVIEDPLIIDSDMVVHHEFASGMHGRKIDYDQVSTHSESFIHWMGLYARTVKSLHADRLPDVLVGIAGGGNRIAHTVAYLLGEGVVALTTEKTNGNSVQLDEESRSKLAQISVKFALAVDDVGTTGGTVLTAVQELQECGIPYIKAMNGHQRAQSLPKLHAADIEYDAMIVDTSLPLFSADACRTQRNGYCANSVRLVRHRELQ